MAKCNFCRFSHPTLNSLTLYVVFNAPWSTSEARSCVLRMIVKLVCTANAIFSLRCYTERRRVQNKHYVGFWWVGGGIAKYKKKSLSEQSAEPTKSTNIQHRDIDNSVGRLLLSLFFTFQSYWMQLYLFKRQVFWRWGPNWGHCKLTQMKSNVGFWGGRGRERSTRGKNSHSRAENQQTQPTYDAESGNRTRATLVEGECSYHCAIPAPLFADRRHHAIHKLTSKSKRTC